MSDVLDLKELDRTQVSLVGGKAANLGELSRLEGVRVPPGFVIAPEADDFAEEVARRLGDGAYAVRSSATAEDSPTASFAGQHESYLNVRGLSAVLEHIRMCRASLDSARAVAYRGTSESRMAVIVQEMLAPQASGVLFTADPVTGDRRACAVDAVRGLGDALVSGRVNAERAVLSEEQLARLERLGRRIEAHFGAPQDIEWCLVDDELWVVQSRPITTLFPLPENPDGASRVYLSVGHQQMMTDAMKPLGLSFFLLTALRPMAHAGGRLFVDVAPILAGPGRRGFLDMVGESDPLIENALEQIPVEHATGGDPPFLKSSKGMTASEILAVAPTEPVASLIEKCESSLAILRHDIETKTGTALLDFILEDIERLKWLLKDPQSHAAIMVGFHAAFWLNQQRKGAADALSQSVPHNVTSEMGMALLDVADRVRAGEEMSIALEPFLERYGMRCPGEIDITRPRWSENPAALHGIIQSHVAQFEPGESRRLFERGLEAARAVAAELPEEAQPIVRLLRDFVGYREYPKYHWMSRYFVYKQALLRLGVEGMEYLTFEELREAVRIRELVAAREAAHRLHEKLIPPRVMTSDGRTVHGRYAREDLPSGALAGIPASAGVVEGRARVLLSFEGASPEEGDILVTRFTDPSWTPLFLSIKGLVTEVGGRNSHGSVVAREYGLPAVVGVENACELIEDGQRLRVNGTEGYVERL